MEQQLERIDMSKLTKANVLEFLELIWINFKVGAQNFLDYMKVVWRYYRYLPFMKVDTRLIFNYLFRNPFSISKRFLEKRHEKDVYSYGETPLSSLEAIAKACAIKAEDTVYELGCGRGRTCFWLHAFLGCSVVGVEYIPEFVKVANRVKKQCHLKEIKFIEQDFFEVDLKEATVIYLYGTCLEEKQIQKLITRFSKLAKGTKIITTSYTLNDYTSECLFEVMKRFTVPFTWGEGDVYLHVVK